MDDAPWMPPGSPAEGPEPAAMPAPADPTAWQRGGDETTIASVPPPPPPPPAPGLPLAAPSVPADPFGGAPASADDAVTPIEPTSGGGRSGRSRILVGSAVVAVLAVGAAGVFAVRGFSDGAEGGAATPTELGNALMTAIENEDVLGMVDVLSPGERDLFRQPMIDLVSELTRLEVLAPEADLSQIAGFDIVLEGEAVTARSTNVADITNVDMSADAIVSVDGSVIPIGALVTDNMDPDDVSEIRGTTETANESFDVTLTAVEEDGRWYFSLFHTLAETLRAEQGDPTDIPLEGIGAVGSDSPEAAVNQLLDSVQALDLELMIQTLNPGEAAALQRYAPIFLGEASDALDEVPFEWAITTREFRVEGDGDQRTVLIDAIGIEGTIDGEPFAFALNGDCVTAEFQDESIEQCATDAIASAEVDDMLAEAPTVKEFLETLSETFSDVEPVGLELRQFDGAWYVSPVSTFSEAILKVLRALDRDEIDRLIELGEAAAEEGIDLALGGMGAALGEDVILEDDFVTDDVTSDDVTGDDMSSDDMSTDEYTSDDSYVPADWEVCYGETEVPAAAACFQGYVDSGELEPYMVPIELRHPECGYDERWTGDLYSLSDAEFIAAVEGSRPCFLALLESGAIDEFDLPSEILNIECFEGRNWFNVFDDPEYDDRYYACIEAANA